MRRGDATCPRIIRAVRVLFTEHRGAFATLGRRERIRGPRGARLSAKRSPAIRE
jgi:hypothetical protein